MPSVKKFIISLSNGLNWVAGGLLLAMILLICCNIVARLFGHPILGTYEIVGFLLLGLIAFSLAYGSLTQCHTAVDLLTRHFTPKWQVIIDTITNFVSIGFFGLIAWRSFRLGSKLWKAGDLSETLWVPIFPLLYLIAINCAIVCMVLLFIELPNILKRR